MAAKYGAVRAAHRLTDHFLLAMLLCLWTAALPFVARWTHRTAETWAAKEIVLSWIHTALTLVLSFSAGFLFAALLFEWLFRNGSAPFEAFFSISVCLFFAVVFTAIRNGLARAELWFEKYRKTRQRHSTN